MPRGGRRPGAGRKPASAAVLIPGEPVAAVPQSAGRVGRVTQTSAQHRQAVREVIGGYATPARVLAWLRRLDAMTAEAKGAERFRALDLLLRMVAGNPAVHGDAEEGGAASDESAALRSMVAALPPGFALVHASDPGGAAPPPASPGAYVVDEVPPTASPAPPA